MKHTVTLFIGASVDRAEAAVSRLSVPGYTIVPAVGAWTSGDYVPGKPRQRDASASIAIISGTPFSGALLASIVAADLGQDAVGFVEGPDMRFADGQGAQ